MALRTFSTAHPSLRLEQLVKKYPCHHPVKSPDQLGVVRHRSLLFQFNLRGSDPYDIDDSQMRYALRQLLTHVDTAQLRSGVGYFANYKGGANTGDYRFDRHTDSANLSMILPLKLVNVFYELIHFKGDSRDRHSLLENRPLFFNGEHQTIRLINDHSKSWETLCFLLFLNKHV